MEEYKIVVLIIHFILSIINWDSEYMYYLNNYLIVKSDNYLML